MEHEIAMHVNGISIEDFGGELMDYNVGGSQISTDYLKSAKGSSLVLFYSRPEVKQLEVNITFAAKDRHDVTRLISKFAAFCMDKVEICLPDEFYYTSILTAIGTPEKTLWNMFDVQFTFTAIQHLPLETIEIYDTTIIYVDGTAAADCIMEISSQSDLSNFVMNDIRIDKITANKSFIIDGLEKSVLQDGINAIGSTSLVSFPVLSPGKNLITLSEPANVIIKYYPTFL